MFATLLVIVLIFIEMLQNINCHFYQDLYDVFQPVLITLIIELIGISVFPLTIIIVYSFLFTLCALIWIRKLSTK